MSADPSDCFLPVPNLFGFRDLFDRTSDPDKLKRNPADLRGLPRGTALLVTGRPGGWRR